MIRLYKLYKKDEDGKVISDNNYIWSFMKSCKGYKYFGESKNVNCDSQGMLR